MNHITSSSENNSSLQEIEDIDRLEQKTEQLVRKKLDELHEVKGSIFVQQTLMGTTLENSGTPKSAPSFVAVHSLDWIGKNIKMGYQMPFMKNMIDQETGHLKINTDNVEHIRQRAPDWKRQRDLTNYLVQENRKFPAISAIISPPWIDDPNDDRWSNGKALEDSVQLDAKDSGQTMGLIKIDNASIYALDGQHRVMGIRGLQEIHDDTGLNEKDADGHVKSNGWTISQEDFLNEHEITITEIIQILQETMVVEYIPAVLAGETREEASERIRHIFTSTNTYAKKIGKSESNLIDPNNGYAIVARDIATNHKLFNDRGTINNRVSWKTTTIPGSRTSWYTTLTHLVEMSESYLTAVDEKFDKWKPISRNSIAKKPSESELKEGVKLMSDFFDHVFNLPIFKELENTPKSELTKKLSSLRNFPNDKSEKNKGDKGHLLLRPHGQTLFAKAVANLISNGWNLDKIFEKIINLDKNGSFNVINQTSAWWGVTKDAVKNSMITTNKSWDYKLLVNMVDGLTAEERTAVWNSFSTARTIDKEKNIWMNLSGESEELDQNEIQLPKK